MLAVRVEVSGTAAHGSTPWLGDNAILKAHDVFRRIETLPFSRESSDLFDRPSINLARIVGGDAFNKVPDRCTHGRRHPLPAQPGPRRDPRPDPRDRRPRDRQDASCARRRIVSRRNPYVRALRDAVGRSIEGEALSIGRDGASDAISFLEAGIPAVEFGPVGGGHHGPERVGLDRLAGRYRQALGDFVARAAGVARARRRAPPLRAVEGGLA